MDGRLTKLPDEPMLRLACDAFKNFLRVRVDAYFRRASMLRGLIRSG